MATIIQEVESSKGEQAQPNTEGGGDGGQSSEKVSQATNGEAVTARLQALEQENARLKQDGEKAVKDAAGAQAYVQQLVTSLQTAAARGEPNGEAGSADLESIRDRMNEDPIGVLDQHFQSRIAPLANTYAETQTSLNRQLAAERLSRNEDTKDDWIKYEKEIDQFMSAMPAQVKIQPGAWENAFKFIQAQHLDEVIERRVARRTEAEKRAFVEPSTAAAGSAVRKTELSDIEKQVARGLGLSDEDYAKWKE